jgi:hypothetical protein
VEKVQRGGDFAGPVCLIFVSIVGAPSLPAPKRWLKGMLRAPAELLRRRTQWLEQNDRLEQGVVRLFRRRIGYPTVDAELSCMRGTVNKGLVARHKRDRRL